MANIGTFTVRIPESMNSEFNDVSGATGDHDRSLEPALGFAILLSGPPPGPAGAPPRSSMYSCSIPLFCDVRSEGLG